VGFPKESPDLTKDPTLGVRQDTQVTPGGFGVWAFIYD
jgi:hypothetical protein